MIIFRTRRLRNCRRSDTKRKTLQKKNIIFISFLLCSVTTTCFNADSIPIHTYTLANARSIWHTQAVRHRQLDRCSCIAWLSLALATYGYGCACLCMCVWYLCVLLSAVAVCRYLFNVESTVTLHKKEARQISQGSSRTLNYYIALHIRPSVRIHIVFIWFAIRMHPFKFQFTINCTPISNTKKNNFVRSKRNNRNII